MVGVAVFFIHPVRLHYREVIMGRMASQITGLTFVYSTVNSGADQRKRQSSASLAFVRGSHRWPVNSPHKWPSTRKMFPFDVFIPPPLPTHPQYPPPTHPPYSLTHPPTVLPYPPTHRPPYPPTHRTPLPTHRTPHPHPVPQLQMTGVLWDFSYKFRIHIPYATVLIFVVTHHILYFSRNFPSK